MRKKFEAEVQIMMLTFVEGVLLIQIQKQSFKTLGGFRSGNLKVNFWRQSIKALHAVWDCVCYSGTNDAI